MRNQQRFAQRNTTILKTALFIGRFQPFHLGHLDAVKQALKKTDLLFIAIGSAQENYLPENPFTAGERMEMIMAALQEAKIPREKYFIVPIPNINNYDLWPYHVEQNLPPFNEVFTCSDIVRTLFENSNRHRKNPRKIIMIKKNLKVCSTDIRKAMLKNKKWEHLVPKSTLRLLKAWKAQDRIKHIQEAKK